MQVPHDPPQPSSPQLLPAQLPMQPVTAVCVALCFLAIEAPLALVLVVELLALLELVVRVETLDVERQWAGNEQAGQEAQRAPA